MTWSRAILLFIAVNIVAIGLMVLPYYLTITEFIEIASIETASE